MAGLSGKGGGLPHEELAHAKLTLSLEVTGVRDDGYHLIDAVMATVELADRLSFSEGEGVEICSELPPSLLPAGGDELVARALDSVGRSAHVEVEKRIPAGAGLGGGSADAAAVLRWAGCDDLAIAASLGADVPFCLVGGVARVSGIGEIVEPLQPESLHLVLLTPPFGVSTPAVYAAWDRLGGPSSDGPNDLEPAALAVDERLAGWRDVLARLTGMDPVLAGSGSTWFVVLEGPPEDIGMDRRLIEAREALSRHGALLTVTRTVVPGGSTTMDSSR